MANKVGMIATQSVEDQRLVRLWDFRLREAPLIRQIHLGWDRPCVQTRRLGVHLQVHGFGGLDSDHKLVARNVLEDTLCDVLELDANFNLGFVKCYTNDVAGRR